MDMSAVTSIITSVGFPIAMCIGMAYYILKLQTKKDDDIKEVIRGFNETVSKMNDMLISLTVKLDEWNKKEGN